MGDHQLLLGKRDAVDAAPAPKIAPKPAAQAAPRRNLSIFLREWHKRAGLFAFLFMGWLGLSGVLINQSPGWGYDTDRIYWRPVMWLYGRFPPFTQSE